MGNATLLLHLDSKIETFLNDTFKTVALESFNHNYTSNQEKQVDPSQDLNELQLQELWDNDYLYQYLVESGSGRDNGESHFCSLMREFLDLCDTPKLKDMYQSLLYSYSDGITICRNEISKEYNFDLQEIRKSEQLKIDELNKINIINEADKRDQLHSIENQFRIYKQQLSLKYSISEYWSNRIHLDTRSNFMAIVNQYVGDDDAFNLFRLFASCGWINCEAMTQETTNNLLDRTMSRIDIFEWGLKAINKFQDGFKSKDLKKIANTNKNREFTKQMVCMTCVNHVVVNINILCLLFTWLLFMCHNTVRVNHN